MSLSLKIRHLSHGATVLVQPAPQESVVSLQAWIKAGSIYEEDGEFGRTHLLEHMLFQAAEAQHGRPPATAIEALGGHLNAFTSPDEMVVHANLPAIHWKKGLEVLIQLLFPDHFPLEELEKEKQVVLEEVKREQDAPDRQLFRDLLRHAFGTHPYARPVLGLKKVVESTTTDNLQKLHKRLFAPCHITFSVVGNVNENDVLNFLEEHIPPFTSAKPAPVFGAPQHKGFRAVIEEKDLFEHRLAIAWPIPSITEQQAPGLEILTMLWGHGASSPLEKSLRWERQLVNDVGISLFQPAQGGLAVLSFFGLHQSLHSVLAQTHETLHRIIKSGPTHEELEKTRAWIEAAQAYRQETVQGRAHVLGEGILRYNDPFFFEKFFDRLLTVTKEEIQLLAQEFLGHTQATLVAHVPKGQGGDFNKLEDLWATTWKSPRLSSVPLPAQTSTPPPSSHTFPTHVSHSMPIVKKLWDRVPIIYQTTPKIPAVHLYAAWTGGQSFEPFSQCGVGTLTAELITTATQKLDHSQFSAAIDLQTTRFSSFFGRNSTGLHLGCVQHRFSAALSLFQQAILEPLFGPEDFKRIVSILQKDMERRFDYPTNIAIELFQKSLWGPQHPYGRLPTGNAASLAQRNIQEIKKWHRKIFLQQIPAFSVVGRFHIEDVHAQIEDQLSGLNASKVSLISLPENGSIQKPCFTFYPHAAEQSHLILGYEGLNINDDDQDALHLLMACLSGQSGLLFQELREKHSLCYQIQGFHYEGFLPGACGFYVGCGHQKLTQAYQRLNDLIEQLCHHELPKEDLVRAKNLLVGQQQIAQQRIQARALGFCINTILGRDYDAHLQLEKRLKNITGKDLKRVAKRLFHNGHRITVVVGQEPKDLGTPTDGKALLHS